MRVKLGEVFQQRKGFITIDDEQEYKRCRIQVRAQGIVLRDLVLGSSIKTKKQQVCRSGDFVVAEIDAKVGGFGFIPEDLDGSVVSSHYFIFELDKSKMLQEYFEILIKSTSFQEKFRARGSTNYAAIRPRDFLNIEIELPTLKEQKEISQKNRILLGFSSKIDKKLLSQIKIIDKLKTDSFELATTDKIENYKNNSYQKDEILRSGLKIKKNCQWIKLGEICQVTSSKRIHVEDYTSEGIPFYRSKEIGSLSKGLDIRSNHYISENKFNEIKNQFGAPLKGDLLLTSVGSIGNCWISDGRDFYYKDGNVTLLRPSSKLSVEYLELFINSNLFKKQVLAKISGTAYNALTIVKIKSLLIPYVEIEEQVRLVSRLKSEVSIFDQILHEALLAKERIANIVERNYEPKHN